MAEVLGGTLPGCRAPVRAVLAARVDKARGATFKPESAL